MKIGQQAFILAIGTTSVVEGSSFFRKNVDMSQVDMDMLMASARSLSSAKSVRTLAEVDLTGYDSIIFKSCQSLSVQTNSGSQTVNELVSSGTARGVQSYVEFDVCDSQYCYEEGSRTSYVVPLSDYMKAFSEFLPTKQTEYCEGCINNNDYCQIQYYANSNVEMPREYYYDQYGNGGGGGNRRRLQDQQVNNKFYEAINCDLCRSYNCLYTENEEYNSRIAWTQENSKAWINNMASCYQNPNRPVYIDGNNQASFAFICNAEGNGVEIGVFLDDECTIYDSGIHFGDVMGPSDYYFYTQSKANVQYIFDNSFSCYDPEVEYVSPNQYEALAAENVHEMGEEAPEASQYCTNVFTGNTAPMEFTSCNVTTLDDWAEVDASYASTNYQESYVLSQQDLKDMTAACSYLVAHNGAGQAIYNKKASGSMYTWGSTSYVDNGVYYTAVNGTNMTNATWFNATAAEEEFHKNWWNWWSSSASSSSSSSSSTQQDSGSANKNWQSALSTMAKDSGVNAAKTAKAGKKLGTPAIVAIVLASMFIGFGMAGLAYKKVQKKRANAASSEPMLEKGEGQTGIMA